MKQKKIIFILDLSFIQHSCNIHVESLILYKYVSYLYPSDENGMRQ